MIRKYPKFVLFLVLFCLMGTGIFYFSNIWEGGETQIQTAQNLKLLTSHSHPEAGEEWNVSFETIGTADLIITPKDQDTTGDLDFASMKCAPSVALAEEGFGKEVNPEIQEGDVLFVADWSCDGVGIISHLVNIARKHTLKFSFGNQAAFAYNNPDSVTDTFDDESKIAATSSVVVAGGQVYLATCQANGTACSENGDCCSDHCVDSVCCDTACTGSTCQTCGTYSSNGIGACGYINSSDQDPDNDCPGAVGTCAAATCSGSDYSCGYLAVGQQGCSACKYCTGSSYSCANVAADTDPYGACTGNCDECNGSGACRGDSTFCLNTGSSCYCSGGGTSYNCQACGNTGGSCYCSGYSCHACQNTGGSCYCSGYSCQACAGTTGSCSCSGYTCQSCSDGFGVCGEPYCSSYTCGNTPYPSTTDCGLCVKCNGSGSCNNYYAAGTTDSTSPGTCTATHYRCDGAGNCTAPCSAGSTCISIGGGPTCTTRCLAALYCGCTAGFSDAGCTVYSGSCSTSPPYCRCNPYEY